VKLGPSVSVSLSLSKYVLGRFRELDSEGSIASDAGRFGKGVGDLVRGRVDCFVVPERGDLRMKGIPGGDGM
jgi:hypothetical protein